MKRQLLLTAAFAALCGAANAQFWKALGLGTIGPTEVQTLYGDSVSDKLLAGGTFLHIRNENDTVLAFGQAAWNGTRWDSLATRIQPYGGGEGAMQTFWFLRFQGRLYACGSFGFQQPGGEWTNNLARLDEQSELWEGLGCNIPSTSGILTLVPKVPDTTLYATGYQGYDDEFCGYPASCVFRYDGSAFHIWEPFNQIPPDVDNYVGYVFDYQGVTYLTGSVRDPIGPGLIATFLRWNGSSWEHVPGWNTQSPIKEILIHNDTLYVAGTFRYDTGGPGNLIASFDGENWNDMGGGLGYPPVPMSGAALDLEWWHGDLLACGRFTKAGNADCTGIAKWDGHQWCSFAGVLHDASGIDARLEDMAIWRDSLYVCGGIASIDGVPVRQVAQWIGGDATGECSTVGINEVAAHTTSLAITPLVEPGLWTVHFATTGRWTLSVYDALGRAVDKWNSVGTEMALDLSDRSQGVYLLRASSAAGEVRSARVVRP
jgi:hypothetical protein